MKFSVETNGHYDFIDITSEVAAAVKKSKVKDGIAVVFVPHSTVAITAMEFEEGIMEDIKDVLEKILPENADYKHHKKWGDHNGAAHIKSAWFGPSFSVPIENGELMIGTWQQIVLIDFDERPRTREVVVTVAPTKH